METCKCGLKRGDRVTVIGWDGNSESGCWARGMDQYIGVSDTIHTINHKTSGEYPCTATLERTPCYWQTELIKEGQYTLF